MAANDERVLYKLEAATVTVGQRMQTHRAQTWQAARLRQALGEGSTQEASQRGGMRVHTHRYKPVRSAGEARESMKVKAKHLAYFRVRVEGLMHGSKGQRPKRTITQTNQRMGVRE